MRDIEDSYPLSPMQKGMLFDSLSSDEAGVDIEQIVMRLEETLDCHLFQQAWEKVIHRHPVFRSAFRWEGLPEPLQDVHASVLPAWDFQDWRGLHPEERQHRLKTYLVSDRKLGFNMSKAPLMRFALLQTGEAEHIFIWTFHHALLDGRSILIVLKEAFGFYDAARTGDEVHFPTPRPFRDYIDWLQKQDNSRAELFWRELLKGFTAPNQMRIERPRKDVPAGEVKHGEEEIRLDESITAFLKRRAEEYEVTVNTLVQGAWALLLGRYSGEEDVVYGATRAGRYWAPEGTKDMVGIFINTLPVRVQTPPHEKVGGWLRRLRRQHIAVREYEHVPLTDVQGWSDVPRGTPLLETLVVFENFLLNSALRAQGGAWSKRDLSLLEQTSFPLTLAGYLEPEMLLKIEFDRSRYERTTISRMLLHLKTLLEGLAADPDRRLADIAMLTEAERQQILVEWNRTETEYPKEKCVHHLFEEQVARTPERAAVIHGGRQLSYRELNERANRLAHYLSRFGIEPDVPVALFLERSLDMAAGLLGILKAGGAYLPMDPAYPAGRLAFMLEDSNAPVIVTQQKLAGLLPENRARKVLIDEEWPSISREKKDNYGATATAQNLAYVMYTSGSTGKPKGVLVPHRGVVNHALSVSDLYGIKESDRVLQFFSISFDGAVEELFMSWLSGAALVLRSEEMMASTANFFDWVEEHGVTVLDLPTAYWHELVHGLSISGRALPEALRAVIVGGEKASASAYSTWVGLTGGRNVRWFNTYGPTECTVVSTVYEPEPAQARAQNETDLPIGKPIANTQIYVLDKNLQPLPVGIPGEMLIGGAGVARGYLNRPELTAERFIVNPFGEDTTDRLYKTGDLVRYLPDGNIQFIGRTDFQLKYRGFRIEPGEIEKVLEEHPSVREALVMLREDTPGQKILAAYWTPAGEGNTSPQNLRDFLAARLPEYMVPSAFVALEEFPLSANDKVDRKALPPPDSSVAKPAETYVAPRNELEQTLAEIWAEVLGVQQVSIHDNFFALGGHSLLTLQVLDRAHKAGIEILPQQLFKHQTIAQISEVLQPSLTAKTEEETWSCLVPLQPEGTRPPFFLVHTTPGDILGYGNLVHHLGTDQPCYGFQSLGLYRKELAHRTIYDMAVHYVRLLREFQPHGPYFLGGWCYGGLVAIEMARLLKDEGHEIGLLALIDTWAHRPSIRYYRYYLERIGSFFKMGPRRCARYIKAKAARFTNRKRPRETTASVLEVDLEYGHLANRGHVLKANMQALKSYRSRPYTGRITLFTLEDQGDTTIADRYCGWSALAAEIDVHLIASTHRDILQEPQVMVLAGLIRECMDRVIR